MYDLHTHTTHSDGKHSVDEMCRTAIEKGLRGIAITDHADMNVFEERDTLNRMTRAVADYRRAKEEFRDSLTVLCGVELGEYLLAPEKAEQVLAIEGLDVVIYSEHFVPAARWDQPYSRIKFDDSDITDTEIDDYMAEYFKVIADTVDKFDFDVLGHLSCPARYITGRYHRPTNIMRYRDTITHILKTIVKRDIALELNTCGKCCESFSHYDAQNEELLAMYAFLGGKKVTLGSDAHNIIGIGRGFADAKALLRSYGFDRYCYYQNRKPVEVLL